jgi:hypothetical protein
MTILTHDNRRGEMARPSKGRTFPDAQGARAHLGAIKRFFAGVLVVLAATAAAAAAMALKSVYFLSHFSY